MDNLKNKKLGIFQRFFYTLFALLSGAIFSSVALGQTVIFNAVGTHYWTVPADVYSITAHCWGGGGGSGGVRITHTANPSWAVSGGGKGGMYVIQSNISVTPGETVTITVGAGGAAGTGAAGANGTAGGTGDNSFVEYQSNIIALALGGVGSNPANSLAGVSYNARTVGASTYNTGTAIGTVSNGGNGGGGCGVSGRGTSGGGGGGAATTDGGNATSGATAVSTNIQSLSCQNAATGGGTGGTAAAGLAGGAGGNRATRTNNGATIGSAGSIPGGGASGTAAYRTSGTQGGGGAPGGRGEVRITYTVSPLPVTLSSFNADCTGSTTYIAWTTASEQNSDYFTVESSRDGEQWSEVETVMGAGTTHSTTHYSILDNVAASYYRLTQTDFDGKTTMYPVIFVDCNAKKNENGLVVYPNPSNDGSVAVAVNAQEELGESTIFLHNINGQIVASHNLNVLSGTNVIQFTDIERGTYLVTVNGNGKNALKPVKLVVQ